MNVRNLFRRHKRGVMIGGLPAHEFFRETGTGAYIPLTHCPDIQTPVNRIAELVASMTVHLMENGPLGDVRVKNELSRVVDIAPNRFANHKEFYYSIVRNMLLDGNGNSVVYPVHDSKGLLTDMFPLDMGQAAIVPEQYGYYVAYRGKEYQPDEILHFRANPDPQKPWLGTGYKILLRDVLDNLTTAQKTKTGFMKNPVPSVMIRVDGLTEEFASKEGREKLLKTYFDNQETGAPWLIPADLAEIKEIKPLTLQDIALHESVEVDKRMAAAIFGVPPFFVGVGKFDKAEYNAFINAVILPIAKTIEQELTRKLIYGNDWFFRFNSRSLYAYDLTELIAAGKEMNDRMALERNEWRDWIGLPPKENMVGLLGLENYIPVELLGMQKKLKGNEGNADQK